MKRTHRDDLWCWSRFDEARDLDFNSWLWVRRFGNVAVDPLPLSVHDREQVRRLGGVASIVVTNSDHTRAAAALADLFGAELVGPRLEQASFPIACHRWLGDGDEVVQGLEVIEVHGSKTPGELALLLEGTTLITGDLVRAPRGGRLDLLPDAKLADRPAALAFLRRLEEKPIEAVLVGDGWPVFEGGAAALSALLRRQPA
jgi:Metallo-beta-lactamase superfamily